MECIMDQPPIEIVSFSNTSRRDKKHLKRFVDFHWKHYREDDRYIPLLDYEYVGFKLLGIHGFFEPDNLFFRHAEMRFFLAFRDGTVVGRCNAFVNHRHNDHWKDKVGFFGQFESIEDQEVTHRLIQAAADWLKSQGMDRIRGPQNLPVNEATPGLMTEGFNTRPVMYYHYNKPYYIVLLEKEGFKTIKRVRSWEYRAGQSLDPKFVRLADKIVQRYEIHLESWDQKPLKTRKKEMLDIYNAAWNDNFGFVPFTEEEFGTIVDDMTLVLDKGLFSFLYIRGEPVAFFGGVPNIVERMTPLGACRRCELLRAAKMLLTKKKIKGFRLGYLGVKPEFRGLGLDAVMLYNQKKYAESAGYEYADFGWVLEDNYRVIRMAERVNPVPTKIYSIYEKPLD